jgi:hypothetical protein
VVRLVLNPIGYDINVPNSHFVTQVQPRPEPEDHYQKDKMNMTLPKDRESYVHEPKYKTDFGDILVPDNEDQQNPCRRSPMVDSTHLQVGGHETHHVDVDTKHVFTLKKAVQPTVPLDSKTHNKETKSIDTDPANKHVDGDTKYESTSDESDARWTQSRPTGRRRRRTLTQSMSTLTQTTRRSPK